ncbi:MAG: TonB-dependent receptor, partial [Bacteroidales bacterium]|nr:TonB-dependent receptor [Bacteroidales bacterium]
MKNLNKIFLLFMFVAFTVSVFGQGSTTSGISGKVIGDDDEAVPGATVVAVHTPSGFEYATMSDTKGYYRLPEMNVGGPYKVTVSFIGFENQDQDNIYLTLGQTFQLNVKMSIKADEAIEEVIVSAFKNPVIDGNRTGAETIIGEDAINSMPTVARNLTDFTRLTPQVSVTGGAINIAGANNRYNAIYIDGAVNNDVFGLASTGTNGGQLGISPISIDAIEQFQIVIAPFDVRQGGFSGGGINAVTKSGSNQFEGSAYYFLKNENFAGLTPTYHIDAETDREKLADFKAQTFGLRVGGPIIKNKLFFFANAEMQRDNTPQPFNLSDYEGDATQTELDALVTKLNGYGYDPGDFTNNSNILQSDKFLVRFDYNINKHHKLMFRHQYTKGHMINSYASNAGNINFDNTGQDFMSITNSSSFELKSYFSNKFSNKLIIGYTNVNDDRDPMGDPFPYIIIEDGSGEINIGSEQYSTANQLKQSILTVTDNFQIYKGKHTFTIGTHNEFYSIYNLFMRQNFGVYEYDDIDQFINDDPASAYYASYSLVDDITGDGSAAAADFNFMQLGVYLQDEIQVSDDFKLTAGIRLDIPIFTEEAFVNEGFNDTTLAKIAAFYDIEGIQAGQMPKAQFMIAPRIGFNYNVGGNKMTQIRGGVGIFTSRIPFVWPGGAYNNNGFSVGGVYTGGVDFVPQWDNQPTTTDLGGTESVPSGQMDLFVDNFKFPQVLKGNIA